MRYGEMAAFEERPHSPYYGSVDATPLFVSCSTSTSAGRGDRKLVRELEYEARAALNWIDDYADLMGNGYISYKRRNEQTGLENQAGRIPGTRSRTATAGCRTSRGPPASSRATRTTPRCAAPGWPGWSGRTRRTPTASRRRRPTSSAASTATSGSRTGEYFALALDADGSQVDALASNIGHLLWSGIVDASKAKAVVGHLMGRGCSAAGGSGRWPTGEARYNPIGYHLGTVWPFDNSFIAWGCGATASRRRRPGSRRASSTRRRCSRAACPRPSAATSGRVTNYPVHYPTACSPQAWSTGAPLLLLRTMLGLEPTGDHLMVDPALPDSIGHVELLDIPGRWGRIDAFGRGRVQVEDWRRTPGTHGRRAR